MMLLMKSSSVFFVDFVDFDFLLCNFVLRLEELGFLDLFVFVVGLAVKNEFMVDCVLL